MPKNESPLVHLNLSAKTPSQVQNAFLCQLVSDRHTGNAMAIADGACAQFVNPFPPFAGLVGVRPSDFGWNS